MMKTQNVRGLLMLAAFSAGAAAPAYSAVIQNTKLLPNGGGTSWFGHSVDTDGVRVISGAGGDDTVASNAGAVYIHNATTGAQIAKFTTNDADAEDRIGWDRNQVAIAGNHAVVGNDRDDDTAFNSGAAYILNSSTGAQLHKIKASDAALGDYFGHAVDIDNGVVAVGAYGDDTAKGASGSVYLFNAATGNQTQKLIQDDVVDGSGSDNFGISVAISGNTVVVGASGDDDAGSGSGSAYVFDAATGNQLFKLTASDSAAGDAFGQHVAVDGNLAIVGAANHDEGGSNRGAAYIFDVTTGQQLFKLTAPDAANSDYFGYTVAISGNRAVVSSPFDDDLGSSTGAAYLFDATTGGFIEKFLGSDVATNHYMGYGLAMSGDSIAVGAYGDTTYNNYGGASYVFTDNSWQNDQSYTLPASVPTPAAWSLMLMAGLVFGTRRLRRP